MDKPKYAHNCDRCEFLGGWTSPEGTTYDLYYCPQLPGLPTILARWGNDGPDYLSGVYCAGGNPPLREAFIRAQAKGYLKNYRVQGDRVVRVEG